MHCYQIFIFLLQCLLIRNKYQQLPVKMSQQILLQGQTRNGYTLSCQQHQMLYGEPVEAVGSRYQGWERGYAVRSSRNLPRVPSSDAAHSQSTHLAQQNPAPLLRGSWASLCSGGAPVRMATYSTRTVYAAIRISVAAACCLRLYTPLAAHTERAAEISHPII